MAVSYWIDERVKVEGGQVRVLGLDEDDGRGVVPGQVDIERQTVVEVGEGNAVLRADRLADNDLVDVIELIPILFTAPERNNVAIYGIFMPHVNVREVLTLLGPGPSREAQTLALQEWPG